MGKKKKSNKFSFETDEISFDDLDFFDTLNDSFGEPESLTFGRSDSWIHILPHSFQPRGFGSCTDSCTAYTLISKDKAYELLESHLLDRKYDFNKLGINGKSGTILYCYFDETVDTKKYIEKLCKKQKNKVILELKIDMIDEVIDQFSTSGYKRLKEIAKKSNAETDEEFNLYLEKNCKDNEISAIIRNISEGKELFTGSSIYEYNLRQIVIYNMNIIIGYNLICLES